MTKTRKTEIKFEDVREGMRVRAYVNRDETKVRYDLIVGDVYPAHFFNSDGAYVVHKERISKILLVEPKEKKTVIEKTVRYRRIKFKDVRTGMRVRVEEQGTIEQDDMGETYAFEFTVDTVDDSGENGWFNNMNGEHTFYKFQSLTIYLIEED